MSDDVIPFLQAIGKTAATPFASALRTAPGTGRGDSPWSPRAPEPIDTSEIDRAREAAIVEGRAAGLRETEVLRAKLAALAGELATARATRATEVTEMIANAAAVVVEAWLMESDRAAVFRPVIAGWLAGPPPAAGAPAAEGCDVGDRGSCVARVNPADVAALRVAIGDAPIAIAGDATVKAGDISIRGGERDLTLEWRARLDELRTAIASEFAAVRDVQEPIV